MTVLSICVFMGIVHERRFQADGSKAGLRALAVVSRLGSNLCWPGPGPWQGVCWRPCGIPSKALPNIMGIFRQSCARGACCNVSTNCRFSALWWRSNLQKLTFITKSQQILSIILKICYIDKHKKNIEKNPFVAYEAHRIDRLHTVLYAWRLLLFLPRFAESEVSVNRLRAGRLLPSVESPDMIESIK